MLFLTLYPVGSEGVMDDMKLRFLSSRRHHEDLEGFQAASQATPSKYYN